MCDSALSLSSLSLLPFLTSKLWCYTHLIASLALASPTSTHRRRRLGWDPARPNCAQASGAAPSASRLSSRPPLPPLPLPTLTPMPTPIATLCTLPTPSRIAGGRSGARCNRLGRTRRPATRARSLACAPRRGRMAPLMLRRRRCCSRRRPRRPPSPPALSSACLYVSLVRVLSIEGTAMSRGKGEEEEGSLGGPDLSRVVAYVLLRDSRKNS